MKYRLDTLISDGVPVALGGNGVVVTGCPARRRRFQTVNQITYHLAEDVLLAISSQAFESRRP
jgi:hypothetical protein